MFFCSRIDEKLLLACPIGVSAMLACPIGVSAMSLQIKLTLNLKVIHVSSGVFIIETSTE